MQNKEEFKVILKEELKKSGDKLKEKGIDLAKEALEDVAMEMNDMTKRIVERTPNKVDDIYIAVHGILKDGIDKIDGKEG